jgi:hypothetical protein
MAAGLDASRRRFVKTKRRARFNLWLALIAGAWCQYLWSELRFWFCRSRGLSLR